MPVAELFDPLVTEQLWKSLPVECRVDHIDKKNLPDIYKASIVPSSAGGPWTTVYINMQELPLSISWEFAWLLHREIQLGRNVYPNNFNIATRAVRTAVNDGSKRAQRAQSILQLTPEEWIHEVEAARMRGAEVANRGVSTGVSVLRRLQDLLVYAYHKGDWFELDVWNPTLDSRIPQREHEPAGRNVANFSHLTSPWLREGAKLWLSSNLSTGQISWSTVLARVDNLKWLQRHVDAEGDEGPCLTRDPHRLRPFIRAFCQMLLNHRIHEGQINAGQLLGKNPRRQIMVAIEQFYQWMYDHRDESMPHPGWKKLRPEHCVLFRPEDKPRLTNNTQTEGQFFEDQALQQIANGCEILARPRDEGGLEDIQAFHALMLLMRTGRRLNEILMMEFEPLTALGKGRKKPRDASASTDTGDDQEQFVARLRYQLTKVEGAQRNTIPVDAEVVAIVRAQQRFAREFMVQSGNPGAVPRYLFLRTRVNRLGAFPYPMATLHNRLKELTEKLAITDSAGRPVTISKTHRFRHTAATNLINAGVPLHVVMRYFGHITPSMTLRYAITSSQTMEEEFLKFKKVTRDGRAAEIESADLYELIQLDKRVDRVLPNGWCTLPPKRLCDKGNACLTCSLFVTDASHEPELKRQLESTERIVERRQQAFVEKFGTPMGEDNVWLDGRRTEIASLNRILLSISDVSRKAVRGSGVVDEASGV